MDAANKSESDKCIEIAKKSIKLNDYEKAIKFVNKSLRLNPSNEEAQALLDKIERLKQSSESSSASSSSNNNKQDTKSSNSTTNESTNSTSTKEYTQEQLDAVKRIKNCKDFYEILGVPKTANENDLKKSYKKLALQFHPDKNKAPGAETAFKLISKAFSILSDTNKRKQYDLNGYNNDDNEFNQASNSHSRYHRTTRSNTTYYTWNDDDFSAEELFNMFFGTNAFTSTAQTHHHHSQNRHRTNRHNQNFTNNNANDYTFIQSLMPIILIVVLSFISSFMISDPLYSLHKTSKYTIKRSTFDHNIAYFVKSDFKIQNDNELRRLERQIEDDLLTELKQNCYREKSYKETTIWRARTYGDEKLIKRAYEIETPSCEKINQIWNSPSSRTATVGS